MDVFAVVSKTPVITDVNPFIYSHPLSPEDVIDRDTETEELLRNVWGFRSLGRTRTLDSHASRLRRKLAWPGARPFVINSWGVGYSLIE